ncbi:flagellar motor switch protein FliN [Chelativorans intermedius]|uniref:Flagellar motor switch protein FliN n=1 Tax=Chelativorans intermedius TaxID=515947 RepID=A0ABV6D8R0_9HYPH|nr:flagellar motor switch protein FliN [Chelativorans intermedius]MCT8997796.1 flagellar motor switch protein FliN [Chelativorans intermedius]
MRKSEPASEELGDEPLNKAIEELRDALQEDGASSAAGHAGFVMNIPVEVQIVLGTAEMPVSGLMALQKGSTVSLDRRIGEPVDIVVNGRRIARGEITLLEDDPSRFGVRLTEIGGAAAQ